MKIFTRIAVIFTIVFFITSELKSQDIHFSQFNAAPLYLNPALTGVNSCDYRFAANFRNQWTNVANYRTLMASYDMNLGGTGMPNSNFGGVGVTFFSDKAGDIDLATNQVNLYLSYTMSLDNRGRSLLSTGITGGYGQRSIDPTKITTDAMFGPDGFDPNANSMESIPNDRVRYWDMGVGMVYSYTPKKDLNYFGGLSFSHLNQPNISFLDIIDESQYIKITVHGGGHIPLSDRLFLVPSFIYLNQGPSSQLNIGSLVRIKRNQLPSDDFSFYVGGWYRWGDAAILSTRVDFGEFNIGLSYDLNVSKLAAATKGNGGPELSFIYTGCLSNRKNNVVFCPFL
ncbi:MAG: type IX secretion system membrane protein PorP/SprF [Chitinophagaceae bacterium]|nr:MAG: type IX secretion system membrane protein PorP/SprF [Chitinophagaceae bacterium]